METLDGSSWDVVIAGTGIQQSLLALSLSRSDKKVLHVDSNDFYGESEAALSLQEAESWVEKVNSEGSRSPFRHATIQNHTSSEVAENAPKLAFSRAYSLSLAPGLMYTRSNILPILVSSRLHQQIDFQAVGSWFVYERNAQLQPEGQSTSTPSFFAGSLARVPNSREDIFANPSLHVRTKGALVRFLRFVATYEEKREEWEPHKDEPFSRYLQSKFRISEELQGPLLALTMSSSNPEQTTTEFAIERIANHLRSIGLFGPGFAAVLPKWGGLSEIVQVSCRAAAVGGAVYVLNKSVLDIQATESSATAQETSPESDRRRISVKLADGETVTADTVVGNEDQLAAAGGKKASETTSCVTSHSVSIVTSELISLFPPTAEGGPTPAAAVVVFPAGSLKPQDQASQNDGTPPVYVIVHTSDTGECPSGQSVAYASVELPIDQAKPLLELAVSQMLASTGEQPNPTVLWSTSYERVSESESCSLKEDAVIPDVYRFGRSAMHPIIDDTVLYSVKRAWHAIMGDEAEGFMQFQDREDVPEDDL